MQRIFEQIAQLYRIRKKKGEFDRKKTANLSGYLQGEIVNK